MIFQSTSMVTRFRLEHEMTPGVMAFLPRVLGLTEADFSIVPQATIGCVIPDLLIGAWQAQPFQRIAALTYLDGAVFSLFEQHEELSESQIPEMLYVAPPTAARSLRKLERLGAIQRVDSGALRTTGALNSAAVEVIAVELKLSRWKEALTQAVEYKSFADMSYVILDGGQVALTDQIVSQFQAKGVGLILQYGTQFHLSSYATRSESTSSDRLVAVRKLAATRLGILD